MPPRGTSTGRRREGDPPLHGVDRSGHLRAFPCGAAPPVATVPRCASSSPVACPAAPPGRWPSARSSSSSRRRRPSAPPRPGPIVPSPGRPAARTLPTCSTHGHAATGRSASSATSCRSPRHATASRPAELRTLLRTDRTAWVDVDGLASTSSSPARGRRRDAGATAGAAVAPLAETFALHSNPGREPDDLPRRRRRRRVGDGVELPSRRSPPGSHPAWDPAGNGAAFSDSERVDGAGGLGDRGRGLRALRRRRDHRRTRATAAWSAARRATPTYGTRVLVTPSDDPFEQDLRHRSCGGVAYLSVFDGSDTSTSPRGSSRRPSATTPRTWPRPPSHEAGHNLGLDHDGTGVRGLLHRARQLGADHGRRLLQAARRSGAAGSYPGANNHPGRPRAILTGYLGLRHGRGPRIRGHPGHPAAGAAVITRRGDVDTYLLGTCAAGTVVEVAPAARRPEPRRAAVLRDAGGTRGRVVAARLRLRRRHHRDRPRRQPHRPGDRHRLDPSRSTASARAPGRNGGYDDYGSLGAYTVSAPGCDGDGPGRRAERSAHPVAGSAPASTA